MIGDYMAGEWLEYIIVFVDCVAVEWPSYVFVFGDCVAGEWPYYVIMLGDCVDHICCRCEYKCYSYIIEN